MHPFLNLNKLTDEDIIERLGRAYNFMNAQTALGHGATIQSIKEVIQSLENERQDRMQKIIDEEHKRKNPDDKKIIELGKLEE